MRLLNRLHSRPPGSMSEQLWSRTEGQALLSLAERPVWKHFPALVCVWQEPIIAVGTLSISWAALIGFRQVLLDLAARGRLEHHGSANALLASEASTSIEAALIALEVDLGAGSTTAYPQRLPYPPPLPCTAAISGEADDLPELSEQLGSSITTIETRWELVSI